MLSLCLETKPAVVRQCTHLCLALDKRDTGIRRRLIRSTLFALNTGISVKHGNNNKKQPDIPSIKNGPVQRVEVEESFQHKCIKVLIQRLDV